LWAQKSNYKFVEELDARWNNQKQIEAIVGAVMKIKLRAGLYLAVIVVLLGANASLADEAQRHWLIGQWQGSIQAYPRPSGAARTLDVKAVSPDGTTVGSWGVTGQELFPCDIKVNGLQVTVTVTVSGSVVQLLKEGNDGLVGIFTPGNGKEYPIRLNRADRPSGSPRQEKSQAN
jgi:hypothetical protein